MAQSRPPVNNSVEPGISQDQQDQIERYKREATRIARILGIDYYDWRLVALYGSRGL